MQATNKSIQTVVEARFPAAANHPDFFIEKGQPHSGNMFDEIVADLRHWVLVLEATEGFDGLNLEKAEGRSAWKALYPTAHITPDIYSPNLKLVVEIKVSNVEQYFNRTVVN